MQNQTKSNLFIWISFTIITAIIIGGASLYYYFQFQRNTLKNSNNYTVSNLDNNIMPYHFVQKTDLKNKVIYQKEISQIETKTRTWSVHAIYAKNPNNGDSIELLKVGSVGYYPYGITLDNKNKTVYVSFENSIYSFSLENNEAKEIYSLTNEEKDSGFEIQTISISPDGSKIALLKQNLKDYREESRHKIIIINLSNLETKTVLDVSDKNNSYFPDKWKDNDNLIVLEGFVYLPTHINFLNINNKELTNTKINTHESDYIFSHDYKKIVGSVWSEKDTQDNYDYYSCYEIGGDCYLDGLVTIDSEGVHSIFQQEKYTYTPIMWSENDSQILYSRKQVKILTEDEEGYPDAIELPDTKEYFIYDLDKKESEKIDDYRSIIKQWDPDYIFVEDFGLANEESFLGYIR